MSIVIVAPINTLLVTYPIKSSFDIMLKNQFFKSVVFWYRIRLNLVLILS